MSSNGAVPKCPLRPGQACTLCLPGAPGPQDCGAVYLVLSDPELRAELHRRTLAAKGDSRAVRC
jgi:hypothetical protein